MEKLRFAKKRAFRGHMTSGYSIQMGWSPEMRCTRHLKAFEMSPLYSFVISGDNSGKLYIWDWKTHKIVAKWRAHDGVCLGANWHPHETSMVATCGWDNYVKLWS